ALASGVSMNQLGGLFVTGCPLPDAKRKKIVELALYGLRAADISHQLKVSSGCVSKILTRYYKVGIVQPKTREGSRPQIATPQLVAVIAQLKQERPSLFAWEIREKLEAAGTCAASRIPSISSINRILRRLEAPGGSPFLRKLPQPDVAPANLWPRTLQPLGRRAPASLWPLAALTRSFPLSAFQRSQYPEAAARAELAGQSGLPEATLKVWFSNRRARWRREAMRAQHAGSGPATPGTHLLAPGPTCQLPTQLLGALMPTSGCCHDLSQHAALESRGWEAAAAFLCPIPALSGTAHLLSLPRSASRPLGWGSGASQQVRIARETA
uniref:Paired box protein Pax-6 n=1 Tax=Laticauda laticaudata TaxID=8630 RepID=A0A8C5WN81_LATLA